MATQTIDISRVVSPEILGPGSDYEKGRLAIKKDWQQVVEAAKAITVVDQQTAEQATEYGRLLQASTKVVEEYFKPIKKAIDELKKPVLEAEHADLDAINAQKLRLGIETTKYNAEREKIRQAAEQVAREAAEKQQREEALERAIELEQAGEAEQAEAVLEEVQHAPIVAFQATAAPRVRGQVTTTTYKCEVLDERKLIEAALKDRTLLAAIKIDTAWLDSKARLEKDAFSVPGCKLKKESGTHYRA